MQQVHRQQIPRVTDVLKREIFRYENFVKTKELYIEVLKDENFYENEIRK